MIKVQSFEAGHQLIKDKYEEVVKQIMGFLDDPMDIIKSQVDTVEVEVNVPEANA
jgi:hypothetical protein